jgi:anhydro-N-acetylmuramic acid kinase
MKTAIYHVIGVMSGTSLDGVDLSYVTFSKNSIWNFEIHHSETIPYPEVWRKKLKQAIECDIDTLTHLDLDYTLFLGNLITNFIKQNKIENIDAVCSHGHTVFHQPSEGITRQIGNLELLAKIVKQKVVCDFRVQDVELGGQGAPLVPIGDHLLFSEYDYCINLGGFANLSFELKNQRIAYDICPVNIVMNRYAETLGVPFDNSGKIAQSGDVNTELLKVLNDLEFYKQEPPKSLGLEWVNEQVFPLIEVTNLRTEDVLRTFVEHIAMQIVDNIEDSSKILITGGGAYNVFLMDRIRANTNAEVIVPESMLIDYKEALIFGFLGVLKLRNEVNCLRSVTGALRDHSSGKIFTIKPL